LVRLFDVNNNRSLFEHQQYDFCLFVVQNLGLSSVTVTVAAVCDRRVMDDVLQCSQQSKLNATNTAYLAHMLKCLFQY